MKRQTRILLLVAAMVILCTACSDTPKGNPEPENTPIPTAGTEIRPAGTPVKGEELIAAADSEEAAAAIAEQYGIELVSWELKVAVFHTEEDPYAVIARGEKNGWPPLEINEQIRLEEP